MSNTVIVVLPTFTAQARPGYVSSPRERPPHPLGEVVAVARIDGTRLVKVHRMASLAVAILGPEHDLAGLLRPPIARTPFRSGPAA